jgi:hypothetical protein
MSDTDGRIRDSCISVDLGGWDIYIRLFGVLIVCSSLLPQQNDY